MRLNRLTGLEQGQADGRVQGPAGGDPGLHRHSFRSGTPVGGDPQRTGPDLKAQFGDAAHRDQPARDIDVLDLIAPGRGWSRCRIPATSSASQSASTAPSVAAAGALSHRHEGKRISSPRCGW